MSAGLDICLESCLFRSVRDVPLFSSGLVNDVSRDLDLCRDETFILNTCRCMGVRIGRAGEHGLGKLFVNDIMQLRECSGALTCNYHVYTHDIHVHSLISWSNKLLTDFIR